MTILEPGLELARVGAGPRVVFALRGEIDAANAHRLREAVADAMTGDASELVLDLADLVFIDSSGVAAILQCRQRCAEGGVRLELSQPNRHIARMLTITGLDRLFGLGPTTARS